MKHFMCIASFSSHKFLITIIDDKKRNWGWVKDSNPLLNLNIKLFMCLHITQPSILMKKTSYNMKPKGLETRI